MVRTEASRLRSFGQLVEFQASRSVDFLKAIDDTIYACGFMGHQLDEIAGAAHDFIQNLKRVTAPIDQDGAILERLEAARDSLETGNEAHQRKRNLAASDPRLNEDDGVVEAYDRLLDAFAAAHNAVNDLCWALGEHDADFDKPTGKAYVDLDEMLHDMGV